MLSPKIHFQVREKCLDNQSSNVCIVKKTVQYGAVFIGPPCAYLSLFCQVLIRIKWLYVRLGLCVFISFAAR